MGVTLGVGSTEREKRDQKSISTERTFNKKYSSIEGILQLCTQFSHELEKKLQKKQLSAKTISIKLKTVDFEIKSKSQTPQKPISTADDILKYSSEMVKTEIEKGVQIRLFGIRVSHLINKDDNESHPIDESKGILRFISHAKSNANINNSQHSTTSETSEDSTMKRVCLLCGVEITGDENRMQQHVELCINEIGDTNGKVSNETKNNNNKISPLKRGFQTKQVKSTQTHSSSLSSSKRKSPKKKQKKHFG